METDDEHSVMTVRTKKRVVKIRQPSNIYFRLACNTINIVLKLEFNNVMILLYRLKEIPGLPKQLSWEGESSVISCHKIAPHTNLVSQVRKPEKN